MCNVYVWETGGESGERFGRELYRVFEAWIAVGFGIAGRSPCHIGVE